MTDAALHGQSGSDIRTRENAPPEVRNRGGVALSLWKMGASETDCIIVAGLSLRMEGLQIALESVKDALSDLTDATEDIRVEGDGSALTKAWDRAYDLLAGEAE